MAVSSSSPLSRTLRIGIVGFGPFGQFLATTMMKQGHTLTATSRSDHSQLCARLGISFFRYNTPIFSLLKTKKKNAIGKCHFQHFFFRKIPWESWLLFSFSICNRCGWIDRGMNEFIEAENDVIMLCTSILSLTEVLKSLPLHCLKRPTLFADVLSVKEGPREVLLQVCTYN